MFKKSFLLTFVMLLVAGSYGSVYCQQQNKSEQAVRDVINKWDAAYRAMDAKTLARLKTPDYEIVNRFGDWYPQTSNEEIERMWAWTFREIYRGKPGPQHTIDRIRFITPEVAIVQTRAYRTESVTLSDGTVIPPFGQTATFIVVKRKKVWLITAHNVHNRFKDIDLNGIAPDKLPWRQQQPAQRKQE